MTARAPASISATSRADDLKAFTDARIAALKAGLQLTPDQEKNWAPFEQALRDLANVHLQHVEAREAGGEQQQPTDPLLGCSVAPTRCRSSAPHSNTSPIGASRFIKALPTPRNTGSSSLPTFYGRTR